MKFWTKIRKRGKKAEKIFINYCKKNRDLCIKTNDLIYFLLEKKNRTGLNFNVSKEYRDNVKKIAKYLPKKLREFLVKLADKKARYIYQYLYYCPSSKLKKVRIFKGGWVALQKYDPASNINIREKDGYWIISNKSKTKKIWKDDHWTLPGMPDFIVYNRTRKEIYFAEIKTSNSRLNLNQKDMIIKLMRKGVKVFIFYPNKNKCWMRITSLMPSQFKD